MAAASSSRQDAEKESITPPAKTRDRDPSQSGGDALGHDEHGCLSTPSRNDEEEEDDDDASSITSSTSEASSKYSTVSQDSIPPIHAYGHTYHGSGRLLFPNDASEAHRLALQHELFQLCLDGKLLDARINLDEYSAEDKFEILDVGAGSGLWACDMGSRYPQVEILGIDLSSALLPEDVPPNVTFEIADAMEEWPEKEYDFIHMRNLNGGGVRDFPALLSSAYTHLKPGGHLEFTEICPRFFDPDEDHRPEAGKGKQPEMGAACREYESLYHSMWTKLGVDCNPVAKVGNWLSGLGAEVVRERVDWLPLTMWGNDPIMRKKGEVLREILDCGKFLVLMRRRCAHDC